MISHCIILVLASRMPPAGPQGLYYGGLLEFGGMEETGFFSMAGYDFE